MLLLKLDCELLCDWKYYLLGYGQHIPSYCVKELVKILIEYSLESIN